MDRPASACIAHVVLLYAAGATALAQPRQADSDTFHVRELVAAADNAMKGEFTPPADWLDVQFHFLRASNGQVYVPFTVALQDVPRHSFDSVLMSLRRHGRTWTA